MMAKSVASGLRYRWMILGVCWMAYIVAFMQRLSIGPLAPFLKEDLGLTSAQVGLFMSAAAFGYMLTLVPAGWLVDRIGVRWLLLVGEVIGGIFIAGMFIVTTFTQGIVFMALAGMGMGCLMPSTTKAVLEWFPLKERATAMGFKQTAVNVGGIITATTLPALAIAIGWHYGFLGIGILAVVIGIVSFVLYREPPKSPADDASKPATPVGTRPSVWAIFRSRDIWLLIGTGMCLAVVEFSAIAYFVLYLKETLLFTVVTAGFLLAVMEAGGAFGKPLSGLLSDRLFRGSRQKVYLLMCLVAFAMCLVFAFLPEGSSLWLIIPPCLVMGFVAIGWGGLHLTLVGEFAGTEQAGTITGMTAVLLLAASMVGPPVIGHVIDTTDSYQIAWQYLAALSILAAVFLFFVQESRKKI